MQPFIAEARLATEQEIHDEFIRLGFHSEDDGGYYTNYQYDIFDAVDGNVLVDDDGHLYFIDTIIFKSNTGGLETYNSLSPRASKSKWKGMRQTLPEYITHETGTCHLCYPSIELPRLQLRSERNGTLVGAQYFNIALLLFSRQSEEIRERIDI